MSTRILVVGSGGREHALLWKLAQSPRRPRLYVAGGNPGMDGIARRVPFDPADLAGLVSFAEATRIDVTICGPEAPLNDGLGDLFRLANLSFVGPNRLSAMLEGSKCYAKSVMDSLGLPTAPWHVFRDAELALAYVKAVDRPVVIKADGLCAGKGVVLPASVEEAKTAIDDILVRRRFGSAGEAVVIEERLVGTEASFIVITDGQTVHALATARDHKRLLDGDAGPNTGGMGALSPDGTLDDESRRAVMDTIVTPLLAGLRTAGVPYRGVLYVGLMLTSEGPKILEFNVRLGDPETQAVLPRLRTDLVEVLVAMADDRLGDITLAWDPRPSVCVVAAAAGYPGVLGAPVPITGLDDLDDLDVLVTHSGTNRIGGTLVAQGGRVLGVTALGRDVTDARRKVYEALGKIEFEGMQFRTDVGLESSTR